MNLRLCKAARMIEAGARLKSKKQRFETELEAARRQRGAALDIETAFPGESWHCLVRLKVSAMNGAFLSINLLSSSHDFRNQPAL